MRPFNSPSYQLSSSLTNNLITSPSLNSSSSLVSASKSYKPRQDGSFLFDNPFETFLKGKKV